MKKLARRIVWFNCSAYVDFGNSYFPLVNRYSWFMRSGLGKPLWYLHWEGEECEMFYTEKEVRAYLIRTAYGIPDNILIPSELLWQAGLRYLNSSLWIDEKDKPGREDAEGYYITYVSTKDVRGKPPINRLLVLDDSREVPSPPPRKKGFASRETPKIGLKKSKFSSTIIKYKEPDFPIVPKGEFFVKVHPLWQDTSWEGRCWAKKTDPEDELLDSEGFLVLDLKNCDCKTLDE